MTLYIGLMSGTSGDGIDASLCDITEHQIEEVDHLHAPYDADFQQALRQAAINPSLDVQTVMQLHRHIAERSVDVIQALLAQANIEPDAVRAIGSHGHTLRHQPQPNGFSWQIGDAAWIAQHCSIDCVSDFRSADIAMGGEGAPLVPAFHAFLLNQAGPRTDHQSGAAIVNIGGIANISIITQDSVLGFDTGPGNALLDEWANQQRGWAYDRDGQLSASGRVVPELLHQWLEHPYFQQSPPKSTGRELFQLDALQNLMQYHEADIAATLSELTAVTIDRAAAQYAANLPVFICGGGVHNTHLMNRLQALAQHRSTQLTSIASLGHSLNPDYIEAMAFAWLAERRIRSLPGNLYQATGAVRPVILGALYSSN